MNRPAEAESFRQETMAAAAQTEVVKAALADAEGIKQVGAAEAAAIQAIGEAEASAMSARAAAYKDYGDAAVMSLILESLPKIAAEVAAPLANTKDIVIVSGQEDGVNGEVTKLLSQLPPTVEALTGVDMTNVVKNLVK